MNPHESPIQRRRRLANERKRRWLQRQSPESLNRIRDAQADYHRQHRGQETALQTQMRRAVDAESHRQRLQHETESEAEMRRLSSRELQRWRRDQESQRVQEAINFESADLHYCGLMTDICQFCGSKNFAAERPPDRKFKNCCSKGKVVLRKPTDSEGNQLSYPHVLQDLMMNPDNPDYKNFRENIRSYNSALSFASMGAKVANFSGRGPYVFKVHGQIFHKTSHIQPPNGQTPQYAQLYVIDSTQATEFRVRHSANQQCIPRLLDYLDRLFRMTNRLCHTYRMLRDVEAQAIAEANEAGEDIPIVNLVFRRDRHSDQRRYNAPVVNEIAMVFVNDDGEPPFDRDIRIYPVNPEDPEQQFISINILSPNLDPMCYPVLFPYGEPGWQPNWTCEAYDGAQRNRVRVHVTMLQYKAALTAIREDFNPIISAGRLTQQFIVDSYLQVEANNLNYIRMHQQQLRSELYEGLADHIENRAQNGGIQAAGIPIILPSSFEGSPRNMRERCADAMSIFARFGPPDLFITFTANPKWPEITENLRRGEEPSDRPDLVARVYKLKLKSILQDLIVHGVLGICIAHVYTIEFQKKGLPHAHILIVVRTEDKFSTVERIDRVVSAEIPDPVRNPRLHDIVTRCMLHGPCGSDNPGAPCMEDGKCRKNFPKDYRTETQLDAGGYPKYKRRLGPTVVVRGVMLDNRFVVPYSTYLLLKYDAHINVEICTSMRAVKYIYKYIYKGFDCADMVVSAGEVQNNEIANYIDARYVSAPEAMWRLLQFKMHDRSHGVIKLPVHLPNQQRIVFIEGEEEALQAARTRTTKLEAWFQLNQSDPEAESLLYTDIPYSYVYLHNRWQKRQRGGNKIVARMYVVSVRQEERFYLRMLLLHVPGATNFEFLRTVDGILYDTFKEAALSPFAHIR